MSTKQYADGWGPSMESGLKPDAYALSAPMWFALRRRTTDGYTRVEVITSSDIRIASAGGESKFHVYLNDDERKALAAALLEGLS